jgi:iron complex outermembrane receptor protein
VVVGAIGNPDFESEEVVDTEVGYRLEIGSVASVDVTGFVARYDRLKTNEPLAPRMELSPGPPHLFVPRRFGNLLAATARGVEIAARWTPVSWWRLEGGYSTFDLSPRLSPESGDTAAASFDGNVPGAQWQARSALSIAPRIQLDAMLFHVGALPALGIDGYTRTDMRAEVSITRQLSGAVVGRNLFDPRHAEYAGAGAIVTPTEIPRSAQVQLLWKF